MANLTNLAAYLPEAKAQISLDSAPSYTPGPGEILVRNESLSFNALEAHIQTKAVNPLNYPAIIGNSFGGTIVSVGPDVTSLAVGDKVGVTRHKLVSGNPKYGSYQKFALAKADSVSRLEEDNNLDDASGIMINIATVVSVATLHMKLGSPLDSPFPAAGSKEKKSKVLVYGGSSPLGALAVKYIVDLGHEVVTTSSPGAFDWVSGHGAKVVLDHTKAPGEVLSELKANSPFSGGIFDAIGTPPVTALLSSLLTDLEGGGKYFTVFPLLPNNPPLQPNIERIFTSYYHAFTEEDNKELRNWTYGTYIPQGLKKGWIIPTRVEKVMGGLGAVQDVLTKMAKGQTGGRKFIVDPSQE